MNLFWIGTNLKFLLAFFALIGGGLGVYFFSIKTFSALAKVALSIIVFTEIPWIGYSFLYSGAKDYLSSLFFSFFINFLVDAPLLVFLGLYLILKQTVEGLSTSKAIKISFLLAFNLVVIFLITFFDQWSILFKDVYFLGGVVEVLKDEKSFNAIYGYFLILSAAILLSALNIFRFFKKT